MKMANDDADVDIQELLYPDRSAAHVNRKAPCPDAVQSHTTKGRDPTQEERLSRSIWISNPGYYPHRGRVLSAMKRDFAWDPSEVGTSRWRYGMTDTLRRCFAFRSNS